MISGNLSIFWDIPSVSINHKIMITVIINEIRLCVMVLAAYTCAKSRIEAIKKIIIIVIGETGILPKNGRLKRYPRQQ